MEDFREEYGGYIPREPASEPPVVYPAGRREVVFLLLTAHGKMALKRLSLSNVTANLAAFCNNASITALACITSKKN